MGSGCEERLKYVCCRTEDETGDWTCRNGGRGEHLLLIYLFVKSKWLVDTQGMPAGLGSLARAKIVWSEISRERFVIQ